MTDAAASLQAGYCVSRANTAHAAMLIVGLMTLVQSVMFCNMVISGAPIYCRITDAAARGAVYIFFVAFFAGYHVAIRFFADADAAYREKAGLAADPLAARTTMLMVGLNAATTISAMAVYSANMFINPQPELCV